MKKNYKFPRLWATTTGRILAETGASEQIEAPHRFGLVLHLRDTNPARQLVEASR